MRRCDHPKLYSLFKLKGVYTKPGNVKREKSSDIFGDFNIPLTIIDRTARQEIIMCTDDLNITITQLDLIDIYKMF